jgi:peroxiredoxin Q/BCP
MIHPLNIGDTFPLFELSDHKSDCIHIKDYVHQQPILIYFYPKAMTPGCTLQAKGIRDHQKKFNAFNIRIFGISPDEPKWLQRFYERDQLNFSLLSDPTHKVAKLFGVFGEKHFMGKKYDGIHRISFLIGIDGKIVYVFNQFKTKNHHEKVLSVVNELF